MRSIKTFSAPEINPAILLIVCGWADALVGGGVLRRIAERFGMGEDRCGAEYVGDKYAAGMWRRAPRNASVKGGGWNGIVHRWRPTPDHVPRGRVRGYLKPLDDNTI